jgi:hypothetical protein
MIEKFSAIAKKLAWLLMVIKLLLAGFLCLFFLAIFELAGIKSETFLIPSLLGFLWSGLLLFMLVTFPDVPVKLAKQANFLAKTQVAFKRAIYYFLTIIFLVLTLAIVLLSLKFIRL